MNAMELLTLIQDLLDFKDTLAHVVVHVSLLGLVDLLAVVHDHGGPSGKAIRSQARLGNIGLRIVLILLDERIDHMVLLDLLQVGVLAFILDIHFHTGIVVHLRWLLIIEQELGRILATDLSPLVSLLLPSLNLRKDDATCTSTFLAFINDQVSMRI